MSQEPPQEDATAVGASVRGASSNPVAAESATAASTQGILKDTDAYTSPSSAPLKRFRDRGQHRFTEKSRESIDNKEWVDLMKSLESSPGVCRKRKHSEGLEGSGSPLANTPSKKGKHQASFEDSDSRWASTTGRESKYQAFAEAIDSPLTSMPIGKGTYLATVEDAPNPPAPCTKMRCDRQEVNMEQVTDTGEDSGLDGGVNDQDDKGEVPENITQQNFHDSSFDVRDGTANHPTRPRLTVHDSAIDILGNMRKPTASAQEARADKVHALAERVTAAANETAKERSPARIESMDGPTTHFAGNNILDDVQNKPSGPKPTMHDSGLNVLKDVRHPPGKALSSDDNFVRHPLEAIDDSPGERDSLQPRICDSDKHGCENAAESRIPTIEDAGMGFVDDDLEPPAGPDLAYHDSAIDVSSDNPNDTFYDIMKDITGSAVRQDPIAATYTTNFAMEIQKPPAIFRKKRKERADSTGLDGDDEASSTVSSPVSRGRSRKRPLPSSTIDRLAEFPLNSAQKRKILVSSGYRVHAEELPSQHKSETSVSRNSQEPKGGGELTAHIDDTVVNLGFSPFEDSVAYAPVTKRREMIPALRIPDNTANAPTEKPEDCEDWVLDLDFSEYLKDGQGPYDDPTPKRTQRMALVPRLTVSSHSHPTLAAAGPRSESPERQQGYKLGMSLNVVDPSLKAGDSKVRITQQLDGFEGVIEYTITACSPRIWPNPLNLTSDWGKVSDVDLTRSTVPFDPSTVEGWYDQFGLMHPYGNFTPSGTVKLKDLTPSDGTCCVSNQMHIQVLRDPRDSKQKVDEDVDKAPNKQLEENGFKQKGSINVQVISKHDKGGKDNEIPNGDPIRKRQRTKYQRRPTRYNSSDPAFEYCCLELSSEEESQDESAPLRPFQENIGALYDLEAIEPNYDDDYLVDFYTLPMTVPWLVQSESESDDDEARDGDPNKAWTMVCESMKRNLASSNGTDNGRPSAGLTLVCELKERKFNSSEDISDYFEDPDPNDESAEDVNNGNIEVVGDVDEEEQVMRLRGGALPGLRDEFGLDENNLAAAESLEEKYPAQDVSEDDGQRGVSGQNSAKRRKAGSGWRKGELQGNGESKVNRKWDSRRQQRQSNENEEIKDDQQNNGNEHNHSNRESARHREAGRVGEKESNSQVKNGSGHEESNRNSAGNGQIRSNEQVKENILAEDPFGSPGQRAADRMWEENAKQNRARACRLGQECEDPFACWCEGMQEIEDFNLW